MPKKLYTPNPVVEQIYSKKTLEELDILFSKNGFRYEKAQGLGAGPGDFFNAIAWIHINASVVFWTVFLNIISNSIYDLVKKLNNWYGRNKFKKDRPFILIYLYKGKDSTILRFYLDRNYTKKAVREEVKKGIDGVKSSSENQRRIKP